MHQFFFRLYRYLKKHKLPAISLAVLLLAGCGFLASKLQFREDITALVPSNESSETLAKVLENLEFSDKITVHVYSENAKNADSLTAYAEVFLDSIETFGDEYIENIQGKTLPKSLLKTYDFVSENLPLFLDHEDYETIENRLHKDSISAKVKAGYKNLMSPAGLVTKKFILKDPMRFSILGLDKLRQLQPGSGFELHDGFLMTKDRKNLLLFLEPKFSGMETGKNTEFVEKLQNTISALNQDFKTVNAGATGAALYSVANANQIKKDIRTTVGIALGVLLLILIFFYRNVFVPLILFIPTFIGALVALAVLSLLKGGISAISLGIGSVLLGVTLDYSLHILTHSRSVSKTKQLYKDTALPIIMSALTAATAFLCLLFVESEALWDLGLFAAISLLVSAIVALVIIPQIYKPGIVGSGQSQLAVGKSTLIDKIAGYDFHKNKFLLVLLGVVFVGGLIWFNDVKFDDDLSSLNYQPEKLIHAENRLNEITGSTKSVYLVSHGNSIDEALGANHGLYKKLEKAKKEGKIISFSSIGGIVLSTQAQWEKIARWNKFWTPEKKQFLKTQLVAEGMELGFKENAFQAFFENLEKEFEPLGFSDYKAVPNLYIDKFVSGGEGFYTVMSIVKTKPEKSGNIMQKIGKAENVLPIDRKKMNEGFLGTLKTDFNRLINYSAIAVFLILLLSYRNLKLALLTLAPIAVTWTIAIALMDMLNIPFNFLNIMVATFVFGFGVDYSIFMVKGLRKERQSGVRELGVYRAAIILSVIVNLLGIGVLVFAEHPALKSVASVSIIGISTAALVSFVVLPFLFGIVVGGKGKKF